jgi:dihydrofolate synthase/folylpolyglutamate synthase
VDRGLSPYLKALEGLYARTGATSRYGLERTFSLLEALGNPHERIRTIHVAGTNGKGSVVAMLYELLRSKGLRVGRYTSPHLVDFRERIVVDDAMVSEDYILAFLHRWEDEANRVGATFFEITTSMAFHYFAASSVDVAVIETGLGGRLDSTNVISPIVSGITSISIDHTELLGDTEASIAREKAGIFKPGIPSVIGPMSPEAARAITRTAHDAGAAAIIEAGREFVPSDVRVTGHGTKFTLEHDGESRDMRTGLIGAAQAANASVALTMLEAAGSEWALSLDEAREVLPRVKLQGRFQRLGNRILDVAHNPDGFRLMTETLESVKPPRPVTAVIGILSDKDWRKMIGMLAPHVDQLLLVAPPSSPPNRAWDPREAAAFAASLGVDAEVADFEAAVGPERDGTTLIAGSFHTVGDALALLSGADSALV